MTALAVLLALWLILSAVCAIVFSRYLRRRRELRPVNDNLARHGRDFTVIRRSPVSAPQGPAR